MLFNEGLAAAFTVGAMIGAQAKGVLGKFVFDKMSRCLESLTSSAYQSVVGKRREMVHQLFFPTTDAEWDGLPARNHPQKDLPTGRWRTYSNEQVAMEAIAGLFSASSELESDLYPADPSHSQLCIGSSISNLASRKILGDPNSGTAIQPLEGAGFLAELQYSIRVLQEKVSREQDGKQHTVQNYAVIDRDGNIVAVPKSINGSLYSDVLLVTRVPKVLGATDSIVFAGLHGPAIQAVKLLLSTIDIRELDFVANLVNGQQYYQAIFEVTDLRKKDGTTVPGAIYCLKTAPPTLTKIKYQA